MNTRAKNQTAAVIVAAGRGQRAGQSDGFKQYREIAGKPVLAHAISAFVSNPAIDLVIVVIHADDQCLYSKCTAPHEKILSPCIGGATRQISVLQGLRALSGKNVKNVLIHDAVRPFVTASLINRVLDQITENSGTLPALPLSDTVKEGKDGIVARTISRHNLYAAQTPQGFDFDGILNAHEKAAAQSTDRFTDDASIAEWAGINVILVEGDRKNRKLTTPEDFNMGETHFDTPDIRTGNGYDVHAFEPGNSVRLCGVDIPHTAKLKGHSDADVGLHALTDALLGTVGDGDIGSHFPPSEPEWLAVSSEIFFKHAIESVKKKNGTITHLDVTLICEAPKISPHRETMRREISRMAEISVDRVSVKATTNEKIGFVGRREGIAAIATATVVITRNSPA